MAYAAVISLKQTLQGLLNSSRISIDSSSREILGIAYTQLTSLQEVLRKSDERRSSENLNKLDGEIREALHKLQDSLESKAAARFLPNHEEEDVSSLMLPLELYLKDIWHEINSFVEAVKEMEKEHLQELDQPFSDDEATPSQTFDADHVKMVGLSEVCTDLKDHLTRIIRPDEFGFFSFFGSAGSGRSMLAKSVYEDIHANKEGAFECGAWVTIGSTYNLKEILLNTISQINGIEDLEFLTSQGEEELGNYLYKSLEGRRYIIALDDIRDTEILIRLRRSFSEEDNGSLVLIATGLTEVAEFDEKFFPYVLPTTLDEHFIWDKIRDLFFADNELASSEFEEFGRKIARNCGGMRLVVARIILVLRNMKKEPEIWSGLAAAEHDRVYEVRDEISEASDVQKYLVDGDEAWAKNLFDVSILTERVKEHLYPDRLFPRMGIMTIYGMAGVGKTKLMNKLFQDPSVLRRFDLCAWVNVGPKYKAKNILVDTLAQMYPHIDRENINEDAEFAADLCAQLSYKKCLIVLDDLWSQEPVHFLKKFLPNIKGELMVTTRLMKVALFGPCDRALKLRLLNEDESWDLLCDKVFGEEPCPYEIETVGKKIAEKCEGLPLLIIAVAKHLSESEKTLEFWNRVVENRASVFIDAQRDISKTLLPSYEFLPQHLKACFLYLGAFPQGYEISASKLKNLWFVEGLLEPNPSQTPEACATRCLKELVDRTVVLVRQKASDFITNKSCALHLVFWHLSCDLAMKNKFFHALTTYIDDDTMERSQRRLCIRYNSLLGFKDVCDAISSMSALRSLLCTGPPHQYPAPLSFESILLKVLEALALRFYEFPIKVVKLVQLRYLALTCNGELPSSISKLWNLQFLIVRNYINIKSSRNSPYLPKEIWDMKELKHLQVSGRRLPNPDSGALLPNLVSLLEVSLHNCTKRILKRIPNLKKLGIQIELEPNAISNPFHNLNRISRLRKLESLKCVVVNPDLGAQVVFLPPDPRSMFPPRLKKLSLSGLGFPWEYMSRVGKLKSLEVLKLRCYAFRGPVWKVESAEFDRLKFLSIEDTDLVRWDLPFNKELRLLSIKHCYRLQQLSYFFTVRIGKIEVVDSHPLAVTWAKKMKETNWERKMETLEIDIQSSWRT